MDLFEYWNRHCGNMYDETGSMCYWMYYNSDIPEDVLAEWEQSIERAEFMSDWDEYIGG